MSPELHESLTRVAPFAVGLLLLAVVALVRPEARERLAWKPVPARVMLLWLVVWTVWVAAGEFLSEAIGRPEAARFTDHGPALVIRVVGIVLLAPLLEELVFRGILFQLLLPRAGPGPAVVGTALLFALAHGQYRGLDLVQVLADGIVLGLARLRTGSTRVPFWMHLLGNAFAAWQRLRPW
jgi:CAAX protease family protein